MFGEQVPRLSKVSILSNYGSVINAYQRQSASQTRGCLTEPRQDFLTGLSLALASSGLAARFVSKCRAIRVSANPSGRREVANLP